MILYTFMIPVYGYLVQAGKMTVDPNVTDLPQVPELYLEKVCEWLAKVTK